MLCTLALSSSFCLVLFVKHQLIQNAHFYTCLQHPHLGLYRQRKASYNSAIEGLTQAGYKTAWTIDSQNYAALDQVMTQDVVYDSTNLGAYGGKTNGLAQTKAAIKAAGNGAKTEHLVTNLLVEEMITPEKARVNTYITWSHWVENAPDDITKTFRIYYRCEDIWVLQGGAWKMQYSNVTNMGYKVEAPYFGKSH